MLYPPSPRAVPVGLFKASFPFLFALLKTILTAKRLPLPFLLGRAGLGENQRSEASVYILYRELTLNPREKEGRRGKGNAFSVGKMSGRLCLTQWE